MQPAWRYFGALTVGAVMAASIAFVADSAARGDQDKYTVKVPGGLGFTEFKGYESWSVVAISKNDTLMAVILGNPAMIQAYQSGIPGNGKPFPDGARMAKIHWSPKLNEFFSNTAVPGTQHDVDFMVKDSRRFADSGGWGYAEFEYDDASGAFRPGNATDSPPQANDAKCGAACHTLAKAKDYVFTEYGHR